VTVTTGDTRPAVQLTLHAVAAAPGGARVLTGVDLTIPAGTTTTLIGSSGAGKTTLLRVIAGLERATAGQLLIGDRDVTTAVPHTRRVGVVFQEPRLFPHLSVADNVAFGLQAAGIDRAARRATAGALLERVGMAGTGSRTVEGLSGGEQQRVNLARALAVDPDVLLLDEPLAAVDPERRAELRALIRELTAGPTCLHVTHDRAEAAELGDQLAVLHDGRIAQHDLPRVVFERPASIEVARLVGATTTLSGTVTGGLLPLGGDSLPVDGPDGPATFIVRPEHVRLGDGPLRGTVSAATYQGATTRIVVQLSDSQTVIADLAVENAPPAGAEVRFDVVQAWRLPVS
jgi:ABC-type sulfate/molybdate transport systems ATPase subunit